MTIPIFIPPDHQAHQPPFEYEHGLPVPWRESPERVAIIRAALNAAGLVTEIESTTSLPTAEIERVHDAGMLAFLASTADETTSRNNYIYPEVFALRAPLNRNIVDPVGALGLFACDAFSPVGPGTWKAALSSAAAAVTAAQWMMDNQASLAYALCRPPGHHAGPDFFGSYCYLNNAALAARRLTDIGKVAILDIDYHHGNGTQAIFWSDPQVLFVSLHIDPSLDYPFYWGTAAETGAASSSQTNLNLPLPAGADERLYLQALSTGLGKISSYQPASLIVSLGFDSYKRDPFSSFNLDISAYYQIGAQIAGLNLTTLLVQEGGYCLEDLGSLAVAFMQGWLAGTTL